jgi:hypothetical protein
MAIGFPPLIPLDRVIPDPNSRFDRFGVDSTQLFGKPLDTTIPNYQPALPAWAVTSLYAMAAQQVSVPAPDYTRQAGTGSAAGLGSTIDLVV